jgi:hypothetical protein
MKEKIVLLTKVSISGSPDLDKSTLIIFVQKKSIFMPKKFNLPILHPEKLFLPVFTSKKLTFDRLFCTYKINFYHFHTQNVTF